MFQSPLIDTTLDINTNNMSDDFNINYQPTSYIYIYHIISYHINGYQCILMGIIYINYIFVVPKEVSIVHSSNANSTSLGLLCSQKA